MDNILLITNTNMNTNAGNVTLILRRAEAFFSEKKCHTTVAVYKGLNQKKIKYDYQYCDICYLNNQSALERKILELKPKYIILYSPKSGYYVLLVKHLLKKNGLVSQIVLDAQGCIEEKTEYPASSKKKLFYPVYLASFITAITLVDAAFVVSNEMMDNCMRKSLKKRNIKFYKVRCGITQVPSKRTLLDNRESIRKELGLSDDTVVFVYSGYRSEWQKIDAIIEEFKKYDNELKKSFFAFFCNTDENFEKKLENSFPRKNYLVKFLNREEYERSLAACDVGFIMRDYKETNKVAFPNKFSDYLAAGMVIALNGALPEPIRVLRDNGLIFIDIDKNIADGKRVISDYLKNRDKYLNEALTTCEKELLYSMQVSRLEM